MEHQWLKLPALGQVAKAALPENRSSIPGVDGKKSLHYRVHTTGSWSIHPTIKSGGGSFSHDAMAGE